MRAGVIIALILFLECGPMAQGQTSEFIAAQRSPQTKKLNVAILVFPVVQIIDLAGPYEVFAQSGANTYTVGERADAIQTAFGLTITPMYTFANAPKPDVLVLPGGDGVVKQMENPAVVQWIQANAKMASQVLTVCTGSFLAAKAGLLDGRSATTFYGALDYLRDAAPTTKVVWDKKYVDSGRVITTAGLSSGVEGSLYAVSKLLGMGHAQSIALHMEYDWRPNSTFARAVLPDMNIPRELPYGLPPGSELLSSSGDREHWTIAVRIPGKESASQILDGVNAALVKSGKWKKGLGNGMENASRWEFSDRLGAKWQTLVSVKSDGDSNLLLTLKMDSGLKTPTGLATDDSTLTETLIGLEKHSWEAWKGHDGKFFQQFLADDHAEVGLGGRAGKAAVVDFVASGACVVKTYQVDRFELTAFDANTALLTYHAEQDTTCNGNAVPSPTWASSLYVRRGGRWLNALYQQSPTTE